MLRSITDTIHTWCRPVLVALFCWRGISWHLRWRTLLLQPILCITYSIERFPYLFSRPFVVEWLPVWKHRQARVLVFKQPPSSSSSSSDEKARPLHVEIHGGAFMGGTPEGLADFDQRVAKETGAVVVSITYRFAPEHVFPAAIDDVDDIIAWIKENALQRWHADPELMTISGTSAGANLALASLQAEGCHPPSKTAPKAVVSFCGVIDLRLSPDQKPKPEGFPKKDPLAVMIPMFDAYATEARRTNMENPRLSPAITDRKMLPPRILLVIADMDILLAEELEFARRVNEEDERDGWEGEPRVAMHRAPGMMHGFNQRKLFYCKCAAARC